MVQEEWVDNWPEQKPDVPADDHGWFQSSNQLVVKNLINDKMECIIELGSWLGKSTKFIAEQAPNATIYAIDHWKGSPEHQGRDDVKDKLPTLYETFLVNLWEFKDRIKPLRMTTKQGLMKCYENGVKPDVIYVDAAHDYDGVTEDLLAIKNYFPNAKVIGDDWLWEDRNKEHSVREAVIEHCRKYAILFHVFGNVWWLK